MLSSSKWLGCKTFNLTIRVQIPLGVQKYNWSMGLLGVDAGLSLQTQPNKLTARFESVIDRKY